MLMFVWCTKEVVYIAVSVTFPHSLLEISREEQEEEQCELSCCSLYMFCCMLSCPSPVFISLVQTFNVEESNC